MYGRCLCYIASTDHISSAKRFQRPIASFSLMPSARSHPLVSSIMVLTKDGDLEATTVHDTPTHIQWGARGTLAVATGTAYRVFSGVPPGEKPPEPWAVSPSPCSVVSDPPDVARQGDVQPMPDRGRMRQSVALSPTFGRGDEDGFPALGASASQRQPFLVQGQTKGRSRTYSPSFRSLPASPHLRAGLDLPSADTADEAAASVSAPTHGPVPSHSDGPKVRKDANRHRRGRRRAVDRVQGIVEDDVSMSMRRRVLHGYGLSNVRIFCLADCGCMWGWLTVPLLLAACAQCRHIAD